MSVYRAKKGGNWYYRFSHNGKEYNGTCEGCLSKDKALGYEAGIKVALERLSMQRTLNELYLNCRDMLAAKSAVPLETAYDKAMEKPQKRTAGEARMSHKRNYWRDFCDYLKDKHPELKSLQDITVSIAEEYISATRRRDLSHATLNEIHAALRQVFSLLEADTGMEKNPFEGIPTLSTDSDGHEPYTLDELREIFAAADEETIRPLFTVGLFSGLRLGDICTLEVADIDINRGFIVRRQRKTGGVVSIPMYKTLLDYIAAVVSSHPTEKYVFPELARQYFKNASTITARVRKFLAGIGIDTMKTAGGRGRKLNAKGIHSLRHTFCTVAGAMGIPETIVRSIVGHLTPRMTELYTRHVSDNDKRTWMAMFGGKMAQLQLGMGEHTDKKLVPGGEHAA